MLSYYISCSLLILILSDGQLITVFFVTNLARALES